MHGYGTFNYPDGRKYEGFYVDDKKNGSGVMTMPDGRKFEGDWKNGRQHGEGQIVGTDSSIQRGRWVEGKPVMWYSQTAGNHLKTKSELPSYYMEHDSQMFKDQYLHGKPSFADPTSANREGAQGAV
eukprot:Macronucleus_7964.p1 GENE.Macronucleus_7964~~Macronucleus_7964.p1  ORF type:complete len:127 (+),score=17.52 Macronucleus_7964:1-381(+)